MSDALGIDVSHHQSRTPSLDGLSFLFARATYGEFPDDMYQQHIAAARRAGLIVGAYHFGRAGHVVEQARAFLRAAGPADLFVLDLETDGSGPSMTPSEARAWISIVKAARHRVGLYHSRSGFPYLLNHDYNWIASWTQSAPSGPWAFWQYRGSPLDLDRFNGSPAQLRAFVGHPADYRVRIGAYAVVRVYHFDSAGCIVGWDNHRWGRKASSAPCQEARRRGCPPDRDALTTKVLPGTDSPFAGKIIRVGSRVSVEEA